MMRPLPGERDYLLADQSMRDKLKAELESQHMDPGAFREFASSKVSLAPEALRRIKALTVASSDEPPPAVPVKAAESRDHAPPPPAPVSATFKVASPPSDAPIAPPEASRTAPAALSSMMSAAVPE